MNNLKVADEEYVDLIRDLRKCGEDTQKTMETFLTAMRGVRQVGIEDGALAERMDVFIAHVELAAFKPGLYADELASKLSRYISGIDEADRSLY